MNYISFYNYKRLQTRTGFYALSDNQACSVNGGHLNWTNIKPFDDNGEIMNKNLK